MDKIQTLCSKYAEKHKTDVIFMNGPIVGGMDYSVYDMLHSRDLQKDVLLVLVTEGGNPEIAYKMARMLQRGYAHFDVLVPGWCNSAGTMIASAARRLYLTELTELGPIDLQVTLRDGSDRRSSSLELRDGIKALGGDAFSLFEEFFDRATRAYGGLIPFEKRLETAAGLADTFVDNLTKQITPLGLGENLRDRALVGEYSARLNQKFENLKPDGLEQLLNGYPAHGFVIDTAEAAELFHHVGPATGEMMEILNEMGTRFWRTLEEPELCFLNSPKSATESQVIHVNAGKGK